ncbi:class I SAM-dependent methyltransferase [Tissierella sp. MSJ-40]|uniref:Class I SAM-dependent methyltransferase n=1 Tax=Tissierella simiarum TaxID=2841534 RepID=A0ABS6E2X5_9FIRM|nr:class I SAM-dependent methyltransferase [Tissierella simiarum]MBU5437249.1 class I SAM-dependent methyltransferase [Tissierella simiarum]
MSEQNLRLEEMDSFFNLRAKEYDAHMKETINSFEEYYNLVAEPINYTEEPIEILDLGCGTGLEISAIFNKAPNAKITCIDLSEEMLKILQDKYTSCRKQLNIIKASYLNYSFEKNKYQYILGIMTMHHFLYQDKLELYKKIKSSLREDGKYIEGDYVVTPYHEKKWLKQREDMLNELGEDKLKLYHIDIPFSIKTQRRLFKEAGFNEFNLVFKQGEHYIYWVK